MGKHIGKVDKTCKLCGNGYRGYISSRFCSDECSERNRVIHSPVIKKCVICGNEFKVNAAEAIRRKCCSSICSGKYRRNERPLCLICGKECVTGRKFCSNACFCISRRKTRKEKVVKEYRKCLVCGSRLNSRQKKFCSTKCSQSYVNSSMIRNKCVCLNCSGEFWLVPSRSHRKFCSNECHWMYLRKNSLGKNTMKKKYRLSVGPKQYFRIMERDKFRCVYCGCTSEHVRLVIDHIYPQSKLSKGVSNKDINLVTCCEICNAGKSDNKIECLPEAVRNRISEYLVEVGYEECKTVIQ